MAEPHDTILFEKLRVLRKRIADRMEVPAFVVFSNASLRQMCADRPSDPASFLRIKGVSKAKLDQYGPAFLEAIRDHFNSAQGSQAALSSEGSVVTDQPPASAAQAPASTRYEAGAQCFLTRLTDRQVDLSSDTPGWEHLLKSRIERILALLPPLDAAVLRLRFGLEDGTAGTLEEISMTFGLSTGHARQIEDRALNRLKGPNCFAEVSGLIDESPALARGTHHSGTRAKRERA